MAKVTKLQFANDLSLYAVSHTAFELVGRRFVQVTDQCGHTISLSKTK